MNPKDQAVNRRGFNRRAFLTGAGTIAIGLPFLESLPSRSAWAQSNAPVFTFFVVGQNGVVGKNHVKTPGRHWCRAVHKAENIALKLDIFSRLGGLRSFWWIIHGT